MKRLEAIIYGLALGTLLAGILYIVDQDYPFLPNFQQENQAQVFDTRVFANALCAGDVKTVNRYLTDPVEQLDHSCKVIITTSPQPSRDPRYAFMLLEEGGDTVWYVLRIEGDRITYIW